MAEIADVPRTGYRVVSTFSGCGGSCLGYRMAGFDVVWASEFVPAAQAVYRANHPGCVLDTRDIRAVRAADVIAATGLGIGDIDVLDGSPPCASFSTAGRREEGWGKVKVYSDTEQRTDDLFFEYARLVRGLLPKVFVAENVSGLVKGVAKGYFKMILAELKSCGYRVEARLLDAQWLGVAQARQRVIFIGVRDDLAERFGVRPAFPKPLGYRYCLSDACPWISSAVHDTGGYVRGKQIVGGPCPTITVGSGGNNWHYQVTSLAEAGGGAETYGSGLSEETDISSFSIGPQWETLRPGETHARRFSLTKASPNRPCPTITATGGTLGAAGVVHPFEKRKFTIAEIKRIASFPDDFDLSAAGVYAKQWERIGRAVPPVMMFHIASAIKEHILCHVTA